MTIKELRQQTGLTQAEFANKFNIPVKSLQNWEIGRTAPPVYIPEMIETILTFEAGSNKNK